MAGAVPTLDFENRVVRENGARFVAGLDEAGRGSLAGPVVAAAVIFRLDDPDLAGILAGVDDSKRLTAVSRQTLYSIITQTALTFGIGICAATVIDQIGIIPATKQAMLTAVSQLTPAPDYLLIDGRIRLPQVNIPQKSHPLPRNQLSAATVKVYPSLRPQSWPKSPATKS